MINKEGQEVFPSEEVDALLEQQEQHERPPAFNPEARTSSTASNNTNTNDHMLHQEQSYHSYDQPPPYYDPNLDEAVVWDENLSPDRVPRNSISGTNEHQQQHVDIPITPRNENGEYLPSPHTVSPPKKYWNKAQYVAKNTWSKLRELDEKHQVSEKTKNGAKTVVQSTKRATITASVKVKQFDEKHQVVQKSKNGIVQGSTYVANKCKRRRRSTM